MKFYTDFYDKGRFRFRQVLLYNGIIIRKLWKTPNLTRSVHFVSSITCFFCSQVELAHICKGSQLQACCSLYWAASATEWRNKLSEIRGIGHFWATVSDVSGLNQEPDGLHTSACSQARCLDTRTTATSFLFLLF